MSDLSYHTTSEDAGRTLEALVRQLLAVPWSRARDLVKSGRVRLDGHRTTDATVRVQSGQQLEITENSPRVPALALPEEAVVFLDDALLVVRKPAGLLTVPTEAAERDTLLDRVRATVRLYRKRFPQSPHEDAVTVVHRLDRDTSGLLVFARTPAIRQTLSQQFERHDITRRYLALAHGQVRAQTLQTTLVRDRGDGLRGSFGRPFPDRTAPWPATPPDDAQAAITHLDPITYLPAATSPRATLVGVTLDTGRQHQIRIHLAELGNPILGETVYIRDFRRRKEKVPRLMLHAQALGFTHPNGRALSFEWAPPDDFARTVQRLRHSPTS